MARKINNRWRNRDAREKANLTTCNEPECKDMAEVGCEGKCRPCYMNDTEIPDGNIVSNLSQAW